MRRQQAARRKTNPKLNKPNKLGEAEAARLAEPGCDFMQADFSGQPVDPEEFVALFSD